MLFKWASVCVVLALGEAWVPSRHTRGLRRVARRTARLGIRAAVDAPPQAAAARADLTGMIPDCPSTVWNSQDIDIEALSQGPAPTTCPVEWAASAEDNAQGAAYFAANSEEIRAKLLEHGTIRFMGFDLMKDEAGFRKMYEAIGLDPCLDPIHSSGLRSFASEPDALYEEVNKESLCRHYIGLHNESTEKKTAMAAAFVCFKPATEGGGEFFIADGEKILRDMDPEVLRRIYDRQVRISVSNLDMDFLSFGPQPLQTLHKEMARKIVAGTIAPKFDMDLEMMYGADGNPNRMQAVEQPASPVNRHPVTGRPVWFCNIHNHARYLRDRRFCGVPEVGMTEVYHGDLGRIAPADLDHINEVCEAAIVRVPMVPGEVLLLDNYRVLHGRDVFKGDRYHAVSWFRDGAEEDGEDGGGADGKPGNIMNQVMNKVLVESF